MADDVKIVVNAVDNASATLSAITGKLEGSSGLSGAMAKATSMAFSFNQVMDAGKQVMQIYSQTIGAAVNETVKYASEVRKLQQITGASAQESSRLIQMADDYKISVDALTMAQRRLAKDGISLTIDSMAKLADQYVAIQDPAQKTAFLNEKLGRSGLQFAEAFEKGGDAIRRAAAEQSQNLVLTEEQVKAAREYEKALDNIEDNWKGIQYVVGGGVIKGINDLIERIRLLQTFGLFHGGDIDNLMKQSQGFRDAAVNAKQFGMTTKEAFQMSGDAMRYQAQGEALATKATQDHILTEEEMQAQEEALAEEKRKAAEAQQQMTEANNAYIDSVFAASDALASQNAETEKLKATQDDIQAQIDTALKQGYSEQGNKIKELRAQLAEAQQAEADYAASVEEASNKAIMARLRDQLSQDGLTEGEKNRLLTVAQTMGLIDQQGRDQIDRQNAIADAMAKSVIPLDKYQEIMTKIMNLPPGKKITIQTIMQMVQEATGGGGYSAAAGDAGLAQGNSSNAYSSDTGAASSYGGAKASGGSARGYFWTGDTRAGLTPYSELVYAPRGAYVFNAGQSRTMARRLGLPIPRYPTGGAVPSEPGDVGAWGMTTSTSSNPTGYTAPGQYAEPGAVTAASGSYSSAAAAAVQASASTAAAVVQPVAEVAQAAVQASITSSQQVVALAGQLAASQAQQAESLAALVDETRKMRDDIYTAMRDAVQMIA